jgi:hypothetical protein
MPTMKLYQNGTSTYMGGVGSHIRAPRGDVVGWSSASARRQTQWLWSVESAALSGVGYALTLTMRDTPESAEDLHRLRRAYFRRLERMGSIRLHWVIEWQERGTPHLHLAAYFPVAQSPVQVGMLVAHWLRTAITHHPGPFAQDVKLINGPVGWLKYLSKHASRGVAHYQRSGHPEGWEKTGRLWGHTGGWPVVEPITLDELNNREFYRVRRLLRGWALADARKAGDWRRVAYLRAAPGRYSEQMSRYQGAAEWVPEDVALRLVDYLEREAV